MLVYTLKMVNTFLNLHLIFMLSTQGNVHKKYLTSKDSGPSFVCNSKNNLKIDLLLNV